MKSSIIVLIFFLMSIAFCYGSNEPHDKNKHQTCATCLNLNIGCTHDCECCGDMKCKGEFFFLCKKCSLIL